MYPVRFSIAALVLGLLLPGGGVRLARAAEKVAYNSRFWKVRDGLPHNSVRSLLQTRDGYLWVGTDEGLVRFDGSQFTRVLPPQVPGFAHQTITALAETADGSLWVGTQEMGLFRCREGKLDWFSTTNGLPHRSVRSLRVTRDDALWVGTDGGVGVFRQNRLEIVPGMPRKPSVVGMTEDAATNVYFASTQGVRRIAAGGWQPAELGATEEFARSVEVPLANARVMTFDREGALWVGANRMLVKIFPRPAAGSLLVTNLAHTIVSVLQEDRRGRLWVGTYGGLNLITPENPEPQEITHDGEAFDYIQAMVEDREGNFWLGTKEGLVRLQPKTFTTYSRADGLLHNNIMSLMEDQAGRLWIGTWGGGLHCRENGLILPPPVAEMGEVLTTGLCAAENGELWFGMDNAQGLYCWDGQNLRHYGAGDGFPEKGPRVIRATRTGGLWIGTRDGATYYDGRTFTHYDMKNGLRANSVWDILVDRSDRVWVATERGLEVYENNRWRHVGGKSVTRCIFEDAAGDIWVGLLQAIGRCQDGRTFQMTGKVLPSPILGFLEDERHVLWMSSSAGILALPKAEAAAALGHPEQALHPMVYDTSDGLLTESCYGYARPACWQTRDGRMWFATAKGLAVLDPAQARQPNQLPPPVHIERVGADRKQIFRLGGNWAETNETWTAGTIVLPPGPGELAFTFAALSLNAPEKNRYRYQLAGLDDEWVEAGTRREAFYNHVPPGDYIFRVLACNNDGVWSPQAASVRVILPPHYWQAWWFRPGVMAVCLLAVAAGVRYATRRRMQRQLERLEQANAVEKERTRLAQDMHDDLGAGLTGVLLLAERAAASTSPEETRQTHAHISTAVRELAQNLDALVWAENPRHDRFDRMISYVGEYAVQFLGRADVRCRLDLPLELPPRPVSSELRHSLYLVVKEALHNVVKSARASEVQLRLKMTGDGFTLEIEDDGVGFQPGQTDAFGNGLLNMRKRIELLGGNFAVTSAPGQGTRIGLEVPWPKAGRNG